MRHALLLAALVFPTCAFSQDNFGWIGQRVITHYGAVLQIGNQVVDDEKRSTNLAVSGKDRGISRIYRVDQVNGNWLWLKAENEGVEGWVKAEFVIPYDQAIDYFTNQIRANPSERSWYTRRGNVWKDKGEYDIAIADCNEAIRLDPSSEIAFVCRGIAWKAKKEYDKAIADYNEAIRLDPKFTMAFLNRGVAWHHKKDDDKAIADYDQAIRLDPSYANSYISRGVSWEAKKEYDKAIADYSEAIRANPKYALAYRNRGGIWYVKKEYNKAIADYNETIRLDPTNAWSYNIRAWLWATCPDERIRDGKKAVESATHACELSQWKSANDVDTLAAACAEVGTFDKALEWQEKANKLYADTGDRKKGEDRIKLYKDKKPYRATD